MDNSDKKAGWFRQKCSCRNTRTTGQWLAIGAGVGAAMGVAMDNIAVGVAVGVGIGVAIGAAMSRKGRNCNSSSKNSDE